MPDSGENAVFSLEKHCTSRNNVDEIASRRFEFKFHTGSTSASGLALLKIPAGLNLNGPVSEIQDQRLLQSPVPSLIANATSEDVYNWRKYGQKLVKGSEFPRSYYKCTYPNCEVKKIFERTSSGQITEIVYKGSHDHPKPQSARRQNPCALMSIQEEKMDKDLLFTTATGDALSPRQANEGGLNGSNLQIQGINDESGADYLFSKWRRMEDGLDFTPVNKPIREPRVVVQTMSEVDILEDGYRWRKYGQKVVRDNPNPRSYFKCTNAGCPVRKHVERASHDHKAVITTYEAKHNHDVPTVKNSNRESPRTVPYNTRISKIRPEPSGSISLDLGVGISPACYGIVNSGLNVYGSGDNPSNRCPSNLGKILMGP